jgi:hypothetical protein
MPLTGLSTTYPLTTTGINQNIWENKPGCYLLGYVDTQNIFRVWYVGRSDSCVNSRLHNWVGASKNYLQFKVVYMQSARDAFLRECALYHHFQGDKGLLDNIDHPDRPEGDLFSSCTFC